MEREQKQKRGQKIAIIILILLLLLGAATSLILLFSRVLPWTTEDFNNVLDLVDDEDGKGDKDSSSDGSGNGNGNGQNGSGNGQGSGSEGSKYPQFRMEAEAEIFKFSYDETGKITVIGVEGNPDKLIAPGTKNLYRFTLRNRGETTLSYTLTTEAYITGTDEYIPVDVRLWDYTNKYLVGTPEEMVDVMELNNVKENADLGPGRYAPYALEWEWPFEEGDDEHDTMLGNMAVGEDLVLHIVIRTIAEYDENADPNAGLIDPPQTGDDSQVVLLGLLFVISFVGICSVIFAFIKSNRKEKQMEEKRAEKNGREEKKI